MTMIHSSRGERGGARPNEGTARGGLSASPFDQAAGQAARLAIRRLKLEDNTRTWATLKAIIIEAIQLSRQA
jgi:hypothetical protein